MKEIDLTGQTYGEWEVLQRLDVEKGSRRYLCKCTCGTVKNVRHGDLRSGRSTNCGCIKRQHFIKRNITHNLKNHRLYSIWRGMKSRCYNANVPHYHCYGGRGIRICKEWLDDFYCFYKWAVSHGYRDDLSIDRINVNGDYEPSNCRWVDNHTQANNKTNNNYLTIRGTTQTLTEWADIYEINIRTVKSRLSTGWDAIDALEAPIDARYRRKEDDNVPI